MKSLLARLLLVVSVALVPALAFQAHTENEARLVRKQLVEEEALRLVRLVSAEQQRIVDGAEQVLDTIRKVDTGIDREGCTTYMSVQSDNRDGIVAR